MSYVTVNRAPDGTHIQGHQTEALAKQRVTAMTGTEDPQEGKESAGMDGQMVTYYALPKGATTADFRRYYELFNKRETGKLNAREEQTIFTLGNKLAGCKAF